MLQLAGEGSTEPEDASLLRRMAAGDERALADVLHLQTFHHMGYAQFREGVQVGLRAAEVVETVAAGWCRAMQQGDLGRQ